MPERIAALSAFGAALNELSQLPCPSIALLNGATLGGGVELALCCDYRLALPKIKIGLPEVSLGIIPGTGGCVRLPRLVGLPAASEWICHGKIYHSEQALKIGLVDTIEENLEALELKAATLIAAAKLDNDCKYPQTTKEHATVCDQQQLSEQYPDDSQPARLRALQVIREQAELPIEQALAMETAAVAELGATAQSKRLVAAFVAGN
jgi:enoyl-CoA hydratase/carnithine racemase